VQTFTPELSRQPAQSVNASGDWRFLDETYVKAAGRGTYLDRVVDRHAQVIDVLVSTRREAAAGTAVLRSRPACWTEAG
jgi:transposase, IS6 family